MSNAERVQQANWDAPQRDDWIQHLSVAIEDSKEDVILVAHSLGCALTAWWIALGMPGVTDKTKVKAALLVAPPDVNRASFPAPSFAPMPEMIIPFPCKVVASEDDIWCDLPVAQRWSEKWTAEFHPIGAKGHINGDSGLHAWEQGQYWLADLLSKIKNA